MPRRVIKALKFRRRREAKTRYKKRLGLVSGGYIRLVVRKSNRRILGQLVQYAEKGDLIIASADSSELSKMNWPARANRSTAYLTGVLLAKKAKQKEECVLDIGLASPVKDSIPFIFAKGCVDGGMKVRGDFKTEEKMYNYAPIAEYAKQMNGGSTQFTAYKKTNVKVEELPKLFASVKDRILKS